MKNTNAVSVLVAMHLLCFFTFAQNQDTLLMTVWDHAADGLYFEGSSNCANPRPALILPPDRKPVGTKISALRSWFTTGSKQCYKLVLDKVAGTENQYSYENKLFFPIDNVGTKTCCGVDQKSHNFHFCDEIHGTFKYRGGETFEFTGDDDLILYINNRLAVDLGGCHNARTAKISLDEMAQTFQIRQGNYYNFDLFHCERHTTASNFMLKMNIDVLPPAPPGYHIGDQNKNIIPTNDTIFVYQLEKGTRFYALQISNEKATVDCNTFFDQKKTPAIASWALEGKSIAASDSTVVIEPGNYQPGVYQLLMTKGTSTSAVALKILPSQPLNPPEANPPGAVSTCGFDSLEVSLTAEQGAIIYYTTGAGEFSKQTWTKYDSVPILISSETTLRTKALAEALYPKASDSEIRSYSFVRRDVPLSVPVATPAASSVVQSQALLVSLSVPGDTLGLQIRYTTDGSTPGETSALYSDQQKVPVASGTTATIKAIALYRECTSAIATFQYTVTRPEVNAPIATPPGTSFKTSLAVSLTTSTSTASIRYTLDGTEPTESSRLYQGTITLSQSTTIKARAFRTGYQPSDVMTEVYTRVSVVLHSWYTDTNGDGKIDAAVIVFDTLESGVPQSVTLKDPFGSGSALLTGSSITAGTMPYSAVISLTNPFAFGTYFTDGPYGSIESSGGFDAAPFVISDSVAPVISRAVYVPGNTGADGTTMADTLIVTFSEKSDVAPGATSMPFIVKHDTIQYRFYVRALETGTSATIRFVVDSISGLVPYPTNGDLMNLSVGEIQDLKGSVQNSAENRAVALEVKYPPVAMIDKTAPNPFDPASKSSLLPSKITSILQNDPALNQEQKSVKYGTVAIIQPSSRLPSEVLRLSASATIYDAVGNVVRSNLVLARDNESNLYLVWDGRNTIGRYAGSGTYVAVIKVVSASTTEIVKSQIFSQKIGVRRDSR